MGFIKANRKQSKIKLAITGSSGSGKTFSAIQLAKGLVGSLDKVAIIDTEQGSSHLYAHLGNYSVLTFTPPFTVDKYVRAIALAEKNGFECLIIDSLSHAWEELLDLHSKMQGNSFVNWSKITPLHNQLIQAIVQSKIHVIATIRTKQDYVINQVGNKAIPEKVGLKPIQRDGVDYEFSIVFDVNHNHLASISKDRTSLFDGKQAFTITEETGKTINNWCNLSSNSTKIKPEEEDKTEKLLNLLNTCKTKQDLAILSFEHKEIQQLLPEQYNIKLNQVKTSKTYQNGTIN